MLILAVTSPYFTNIKDQETLANAVGRLIVYAATTSNPDWKNSGSIAQKEEAINNIKAVFDGSDVISTNWDFKIDLKNGFGVWVTDAEEWKKLEKGSCSLPDNPDKSIFRIIEDTHGSEVYKQYLLEVTYGDMITKCRGLEEYGSKRNILDRALWGTNLAKGVALYSGSCAAATLLCGTILSPITGGESIVMSGKTAAIDCTVAPLMAVTTYRITELVTDTKSNLLAPAAAGGARTYIFDTYYTANKLIAQLRTVGQPGGLTDDQAQKVAQQLAKLIKKLKRLGFEVDDKLLTNIDDMQNASGDELKNL
ncbi:hypothetical protein [Thermococcus sp.]